LPATLYAPSALDDDASPSDASGSDYGGGSDSSGSRFSEGGTPAAAGAAGDPEQSVPP
jgi:hypothetical protein